MKAYVCKEDASEGFVNASSADEAKKLLCDGMEDDCSCEGCEGPKLLSVSSCDPCPLCGRPPLYTPVKPEDVKNGWYWSVDPAGKKTVDRIVWKYIVGGAQDVHVNDLAEAGFAFFRIPELPDDLEVAE